MLEITRDSSKRKSAKKKKKDPSKNINILTKKINLC